MTLKSHDLAHIRSVVLAGHAGAGKTTLAEQVLFRAGAIPRLGRVDDGTAHLDHEPEEQKQHRSLSLAVGTFERGEHEITLVDTPGYPDFVAEMLEGFHAADAALIVMDASGGVEAGLESAVKAGRATGTAACFVLNKCDRENANPSAALDALRAEFGNKIAPLHLAIGAADTFSGYVDLVHRKAYRFENGAEVEIPVPDELADEVARRRDQLLEAAAEADDDVFEKYLSEEEISDAELDACLHKGVRESVLAPVLVASATKGIGLNALLDAIVRYLPSPEEEGPYAATDKAGKDVEVAADGSQLLVRVFKTAADPFVGRLTYLRVLSGTLKSQGVIFNATKGEDERIGQLLYLHGKEQEPAAELRSGEIGAVAKLGLTETGDTLTTRDAGLVLPAIDFPEPTLQVAIDPVSKGDLDKMGPALQRMLEEEPTARVERSDTGEQILRAVGEAHVAVITERLKRKFGAAIATRTPDGPLPRDDPRLDQGPRPVQEADRRARHVRRRVDRARAEPRGRRRVRRQGRRRLGAQGLLRGHREGHPRDGRRGRVRGLPADRLQGDPLRRLVPPGRLERAVVQDRGLDGAQGRRPAGEARAARADHGRRRADPRAVHGRGQPRPQRAPRPRAGHGPRRRAAGDQRPRAAGRAVLVRDRAAVADRRPRNVQRGPRPLRGRARRTWPRRSSSAHKKDGHGEGH